jgi:hypothetical protein
MEDYKLSDLRASHTLGCQKDFFFASWYIFFSLPDERYSVLQNQYRISFITLENKILDAYQIVFPRDQQCYERVFQRFVLRV